MEPDSPSPQMHAAALIEPREKPRLSTLLRTLSPAERLLLYVLTFALAVSAFVLLAQANASISTEVPTHGGRLVEGAVGTPRFVNPLLAVSQPDTDLTALVYSGLVRANQGGGYVPDLAETYEISDDGTVYTFHLRDGLLFHDGTKLTADDVLFTVSLAQNPDIKSPRRADWEGVQAEKIDDRTVAFTLPHAYAPFLENATLGILPQEAWSNVAPEEFPFSSLNTHPVGSGPYYVEDVTLDATGAPEEYILDAFQGFALGEPNLTRIIYRTYANAEALIAAYEDGDIESFVADSPKNLPRGVQGSDDMRRLELARVFAVFLNQNHAPQLAKAEVRAALDAAIKRETIVESVLGGFGNVLSGPIPPGLLTIEAASSSATTSERGADAAREILTRNGWKFSTASSTEGSWSKGKETLTMSLATADTEELVATAHMIADAWKTAGIPTTVQVYPLTEFNQTVLRPRNFDAILFGEVVGRTLDLFAFWHSSQRNDPGLNLALYTSATADKTLAAARAETMPEKRAVLLAEFVATLAADRPALFLYSPEIAYILPSRINGVSLGTLTNPSDRFGMVHEWYRDTERVWNIFK